MTHSLLGDSFFHLMTHCSASIVYKPCVMPHSPPSFSSAMSQLNTTSSTTYSLPTRPAQPLTTDTSNVCLMQCLCSPALTWTITDHAFSTLSCKCLKLLASRRISCGVSLPYLQGSCPHRTAQSQPMYVYHVYQLFPDNMKLITLKIWLDLLSSAFQWPIVQKLG